MQVRELLLTRYSMPRLSEPAPEGCVLDDMLKAALNVPDHAGLTPWRYIVCSGKGLNRLGDVLEQAAVEADMSDRDIERAPQLPLRAPMVIVAIAAIQDHPKVPAIEQANSASCGVFAMQLMAKSHGFDSFWRTGTYAHLDETKRLLGVADTDEIVGFLYVGSAKPNDMPRPQRDISQFCEFWQ